MLSGIELMEMIKAEALRLGFVLCSATSPEPPQHYPIYKNWLEAGCNAGMDYLSRPDYIAKRNDPHTLMKDVRTILILAAPYPKPDRVTSLTLGTGRVSSYAWGQDYHTILKQKTTSLCQWLCASYGKQVEYSIFTDSAPIPERELACRAGLGWIGKNTCLISSSFGSFFFLTEVFLNIELPLVSVVPQDRCGTCRRCIEACPTHCLNEDRTMDARKCISYLTIENKADIPVELRQNIGQWIFGCDICQHVCPWNQKITAAPMPEFSTVALPMDLKTILNLSESDFRTYYKDSPILRAKRFGMMRNSIIAAANQMDHDVLDELLFIQRTEPNDVLRSLAAWAVEVISPKN
jgi:epoxyqueuosine reductase